MIANNYWTLSESLYRIESGTIMHVNLTRWLLANKHLVNLVGLVRNHTLLIDSRVRIEASKWNESESFVFVSSRLCSFLYFCWRFYCSVLDKGFLWLFFSVSQRRTGVGWRSDRKIVGAERDQDPQFSLNFSSNFRVVLRQEFSIFLRYVRLARDVLILET